MIKEQLEIQQILSLIIVLTVNEQTLLINKKYRVNQKIFTIMKLMELFHIRKIACYSQKSNMKTKVNKIRGIMVKVLKTNLK